MEPTPMEKWTPREKREFEAQLAAAQGPRSIGGVVSWRGLERCLLTIQESSKVHAGFIWDVRRFNGILKLYVSTTDPASPGFLKPGYREVAIDPAELGWILASLADIPATRWHPDEAAAGPDAERIAVAYHGDGARILWWWSDQGPQEWRDLTASVRRIIQRFKQLDPATLDECAREA